MRAWVMFLFLTGCIGLDSTLGEKAGTGTDGTETENNGIFAVDPGSVDFGTLAIGAEADEPVTVRNSEYWIAPDVKVSRAEKSRVRAFGRNWNFAGRSAELCTIDWGN